MSDELSLVALAEEIQRCGLKFADVVDGRFEMLSQVEIEAIAVSLRYVALCFAYDRKPVE